MSGVMYTDDYLVEIWNKIYPVEHPRKDWGGRIHSKVVPREEVKDLVLGYLDNPETVAFHISRQTKR